MAYQMLFLSLLVAFAALQGSHADVKYVVINNATDTYGGARFDREIGANYSKQTLASATDFIWRIFRQKTTADRKNVSEVSLIIDSFDGVEDIINSEIRFSANYIGNYSGDLKREVTGLLYHMPTHVWQWTGNGEAPEGLLEGIADFVRLKANYVPCNWVQPGQGIRWDEGYDVTARFLDYLNSLKVGFVAELNKKMKTGYSDDYFVDLLGKTVDQLWRQYKAKYGPDAI